MTKSNNPPHKILELSKEQADFLLENCDSNIAFGLSMLGRSDFSRVTLEALIAKMELFKEIRKKLKND